ncbi:2-dehydropantoate 2-reductase [Diplonema papillatum]|nr:2-dehydropantoate 2-reductase [Diplonema papillatum]
MKILIMGSGGVGAYFGALLARSGNTVTFVARGANLQALRERGLSVKSINGDFNLETVAATQHPAEVGVVDLVLMCVKAYSVPEAAALVRPVVGESTTVLCLQNGVEASQVVQQYVSQGSILPGVARVSAHLSSPGVVRHVSKIQEIIFGERDGAMTPRVEFLDASFREAGIQSVPSDRIDAAEVPETKAMLLRLAGEVVSVAEALGIPLRPDLARSTVELMLSMDRQSSQPIKTSMQLDIESGKRSELDSLIGVITRKGKQVGVATPVADMVYAALLPVDLLARNALKKALL